MAMNWFTRAGAVRDAPMVDPAVQTERAAQRTALSNGHLVRYAITVLLNIIVEWAVFLGVLVYAFERGGASTTGYAAIGMLMPYVLFAPIAAAMAERYPPQRVRLGGMALQTLAFATAALAAVAGSGTANVVVAGMIGIGGATMLGPAGAALRPAIVRSSRELTVANLWTGYADSISVFAGPLLAAVMLSIGGAPAVLIACAATSAAAFLISLFRRPVDPPGGSELTDRIGAFALMRREVHQVGSRPGLLGVMAVAGGQYFVIGSLDIVLVVAAQDELGLGPSGPGVLAMALGAGAFISGAVTTVLVRRPRLAPTIAVSLLISGLGLIVLGAALSVVAAFVILPVLGLLRSLQDLLGQILLQRSTDPDALGAVFAVLELASGIALITGSLVAQVLIAVSGVRAALLGTGALFLVLLAVTATSLRQADDSADVPVVTMSLLRRLPVFRPLPRAALEIVARSATEVHVGAGHAVITQGDAGDRFYAVADGDFDVTIDDQIVQRCERGDSFGEIALLADVPRAATVTARRPGTLVAVDRRPFLIAVTGHDSSRQAAWGVVQRMQGDAVGLDGPHQFATPDPDDAER